MSDEDTVLIVDADVQRCEIRETSGIQRLDLAKSEYHMEMDVSLDTDEAIEGFAQLTGTPIVRVSNEELGWQDKPFLPIEP